MGVSVLRAGRRHWAATLAPTGNTSTAVPAVQAGSAADAAGDGLVALRADTVDEAPGARCRVAIVVGLAEPTALEAKWAACLPRPTCRAVATPVPAEDAEGALQACRRRSIALRVVSDAASVAVCRSTGLLNPDAARTGCARPSVADHARAPLCAARRRRGRFYALANARAAAVGASRRAAKCVGEERTVKATGGVHARRRQRGVYLPRVAQRRRCRVDAGG